MPYGNTDPYSYRDIQDKFNSLQQTHPDLVQGMSLHDYSQRMNEQTNSTQFSAGLDPNIVKDASAEADRMIDATGVTDITGGIGKALGGLISPQAGQIGEEYGRGLVRPLVAGAVGAGVGTLVAPGVGTAAGAEAGLEAEGVGAGAALAKAAWSTMGSNLGYGGNQAVQTYTDTGSPTAALASGALGYLTHGFGQLGEATAARLVGTKIGSTLTAEGRSSVEGALPTLAEMATEKFGLTAGYAINNEVTRQAVNVAMGHGLTIPTTSEAIGDIANAAAPLLLGVAGDAMGVRDALQPDRGIRSLSEGMNLVEAAQNIRKGQIKDDVERQAQAAQTTLENIKQMDVQRAGAIDQTEVGRQVLSPDDFDKMQAEGEGMLSPEDRNLSFAGTPVRDMGIDTARPPEPQSLPENRQAPGEQVEAKPNETSESDVKPPEGQPAPEKTAGSSEQVEPSGTVEEPSKLPPATQEVVKKVPEPPTFDSIVNRMKMLNRSNPPPSLESFQDLVNQHTELMKQVADDPEFRQSLDMPPLSDKYFQQMYQHLTSEEGGSMEPVAALNRMLKATQNLLALKYKQLSTFNEQRFLKRENEQQKQDDLVQETTHKTSKQFLNEAAAGIHGQEVADTINETLEKQPEVPINTAVAIERWVRQSRLNKSPEAREILKTITDQQKTEHRRLKPEEVEEMLKGKTAETADDVRYIFRRTGFMWNRDGSISQRSGLRIPLILKDNPSHPEEGSWDVSLKSYLENSAERERIEARGTASLDKEHGDGESTIAQTDLAGDIDKMAHERHENPTAVAVAVQHAQERVNQTQGIRNRLNSLTVPELVTLIRNSKLTVPASPERFKALLSFWADATSMAPSQRVMVSAKGKPNQGGLDHYLANKEGSPWKALGSSNFPKYKREMEAVWREFSQLDANGVPSVKPEYATEVKLKTNNAPSFQLRGKAPSVPTEDGKFAKTEVGENAIEPPGEVSHVGDTNATSFVGRPRDNQLALSARNWFQDYLRTLGVDEKDPMFGRYVDSMTRVAALFPQIDKARVGGILRAIGQVKGDEGIGGISAVKYGPDKNGNYTKMLQFIGLSYEKLDSEAAAVFVKNVIAAHEFNHAVFRAKDAGQLSPELSKRLDEAIEDVKAMSDDDRRAILDTVSTFALPREIREGGSAESVEIQKAVKGFTDYGVQMGVNPGGADPEEFLSTLFGYLGIGMANPADSTKALKNFEQLRQFIPDRLRQFQQAYYTDLLHYTKALQGFFDEHYEDKGLGATYGKLADMYKDLTRDPEEVNAFMDAMHTMEALQPENFLQMANDARAPDMVVQGVGKYANPSVTLGGDYKQLYGLKLDLNQAVKASLSVKQALKTAKDAMLPDPKLAPLYGHNPGFWSLFTPLAQFAERYPVMRPLADTLLSFEGSVNNANALALSPFGTVLRNGKFEKTENMDAMKSVVRNPQAKNALNALFLWQNENEKLATMDDIKKFFPTFSASNQRMAENILSALTATSKSLETVGQGTINTSMRTSGHLIGSLAMSMQRDMSAKNGEQIGTNLMQALIGMQSADPATKMQSESIFGAVRMQIDPQNWPQILKLASQLSSQHGDLIDKLTNRPWYTPETRPHGFGMYFTKGDKPGFTSFKTEKEAAEALEKYNKYNKDGVNAARLINPYDSKQPGGQYSDAAVNHFVQLEQTAFEAARQQFAGDPDKLKEFASLYSPGTAILQELGSRGIRKNMQERKLVQGREDIDMLSNSLNYVDAMNRSNARNYIRSKTLLQGQDPTLSNEPRLKSLFFDHMNAVLNPPSSGFGALKHITTMYYIGGNFSSAAMQAFQPIQATLPHLTRNGVGVLQGIKYFTDACGTLFKAYGMGKGIVGDPVLQAAFNKATSERIVGFQNVMSQFDHFDDAFVSRVKNFANDSGDDAMTPSKLLQNVSYQTTRILSYMFQHITEHNTRVSWIAGFNAARDQGRAKGLVGQDLTDYAYGEAKRTVEESLHTGGPASRPLGFGRVGKLYGVMGNLYALNHFNFSMISIMARYGLESIGHTGLEGAALHNARKAFGQAMVTQLVLSGAMGLPFAGAAVAMLEELFPNLQLNKDMREGIAGLAGDDHALGGFLADASLKGLATAMSPVDVSGRLGLSAVLGEDPYYGFDAKDLLGASGSMLYNMAKGVGQIAQGDPSGATQFLPNALQRMYHAAANGGRVTNSQGQVIFQPTDAQRVLMAIGLRPKDESHLKEQSMIDERNQTIQSRQLQRWYLQQVQTLQNGDYAGVKTALYQKAQEDPTFSPIVALKRIVAEAQKSQTVQAPSDRGSAAQLRSREAVGASFGQPTTAQSQPSQVEQLLQRATLERQVGIPGAGQIGPAELSKARLTDYLMQRYNLDSAQAEAMVGQLSAMKKPTYQGFHPGAVSPLSALAGQTPQP